MALATEKEVEALADALTASADSIHERLMKAIKERKISKQEAQAALQDEAILRQRANALYIDAAVCVVKALPLAQQELLDAIRKGDQKLKQLQDIAAAMDFVADMLSLATAIYARKPGPILAAFREVKNDVDQFG